MPSGADDTELQQSCQGVGVKSQLLQCLLGAAIASQVQIDLYTHSCMPHEQVAVQLLTDSVHAGGISSW